MGASMAHHSCTRNHTRKAAVALGIGLFLFALPLPPTRAGAQTCGIQGPGFQGGSITQILRWKKYGTSTLEALPKGPLPSGQGINVYVDAVAQLSGYCEDLDWNGSSCVVDPNGTWYNQISGVTGLWSRPGEPPDNWLSIESAINPNGTTAWVQFMDSRDDATTSGGPVTVLPSGAADSPSGMQPGIYTHRTTSNVTETPCDGPGDLSISSGPYKAGITDTDNAKDICVDEQSDLRLDSGVARIEVAGPLPDQGGDAADRIGNPCSARSGNKSEREVDSPGPVLPFVRTYSSRAMYDLGLGYGWSSPYHGRILTPLGTILNVVRTNGHAEVFTKQVDGSWLGDADTRYAITENASGFTLSHRDGRWETYGTHGLLVSESDPSGTTTTYTYDAGTGLLTTVHGPYGHQLSFAYDASEHLQTVTPPSGDPINYSYTNDNLVAVTYPDTRTRLYHYENTSQPHKLTGITDENGARYATFGYDSQGRATSTEHATTTNGAPQERFTLVYNTSTKTTVTDPRGYAEEFVFNEKLKYKRLTSHKHLPDNKAVAQTFDVQNNVLTRVDGLGRTTAFTWNATNQMTSRTEAWGTALARTTTFAYYSPSLALPTAITRPSVYAGQSATTQLSYDPVHLRPTQVSESGFRPDGTAVSRTTSFQYNARGQVTQIDGPRTDVSDLTTFAYWECTTGAECGRLRSITNALGRVTSYDLYDAEGRLLETTDPIGTETATVYDDRGRVLSITLSPTSGLPRTWSFTYDAAGQLETSTSPAGVVLRYEYDAAHDLQAIEDSDGNRTEYFYDLAGNRIDEKLKDPSGTLQHQIQAAYDTRNRLSMLIEAASITQIVFDAVGNLASQTDPNSHATTFGYDPLDRLMSQIDALVPAGTTQYEYRVNDTLSQLTAPNGVATGYATDDLGNAVSETSPDRGSWSYAHDASGNLTSRVRPTGTDTLSYDALSRPLTRSSGAGQNVTFSYDSCFNGTGRLCNVVNGSGAGTMSYEYDAFGNPTHKTQFLAGRYYHTYYTWDADDRLVQITYPTGQIVTYTRDAQGRVQAVTLDGANIVTNRSYRGDGKLLAQVYGNGLAETRTYNGLGLLASYALGSVESESFTYDAAGNLTARSGASWSLGYGYDALDRLNSDTGGSGSRSYNYDENGNRLSKTVSGSPTAYTYESATNRLATVAGNTVTLDGEGRTTAVPGFTYQYNSAGRLATVTQGGTTKGTYSYDAWGLRRRKVASGVVTLYHYDETGRLLAETSGTGVIKRTYVWADAAPIAQTDGTTLTYLHTDHLETPRWGTDTAGALVWRWKSDGFGEALPEEDVDGDAVAVTVNLRFPGQYYDAESGLHQNWMRDYQSGYGRYAQADPIGLPISGRDTNLYSYAMNNPVNFIDPNGEFAVPVLVAAATILGLAHIAVNSDFEFSWKRTFFRITVPPPTTFGPIPSCWGFDVQVGGPDSFGLLIDSRFAPPSLQSRAAPGQM
jgi:RHS repeat-associated protein